MAAELPDGALGAVVDDERPLVFVVVKLDLGRRIRAVDAPAGRPVVGLRAALLTPGASVPSLTRARRDGAVRKRGASLFRGIGK